MTDKRKKFEELAVPRTKRAIKAIRILANMGGNARYDYEFGAGDVELIAFALDKEVERLRLVMIPPGRQLDIEFDLLDRREPRTEAPAASATLQPPEASSASGGAGRPETGGK